MTVTLNIQDDQELRDYCKEMMKNTINGITRNEMKEFVKRELDRKIKGLSDDNFRKMMIEAFKHVIQGILHKEFNVRSWDQQWIKPCVNDYLINLLSKTGTKEQLILEIAKQVTGI